ncbi:MAG: heavy metal-binding domain-containing protein [Acidobacteriota bacterium]
MNKNFKIISIIIFLALIFAANTFLISGEKEFVECSECGHKMEKGKTLEVKHCGKTLHVCGEKCKAALEKKEGECIHKAMYKCPMKECNYTSEKDGKCPKCGMDLEKVEKKAVYQCTTKGCKYTSDKAGKCPMCKTDLKKKTYDHKKKGCSGKKSGPHH